MSKNLGDPCIWPEQEAVDRWWSDVSLALKEAVTEPRLVIERRVTRALTLLDDLLQALRQSRADEKLVRVLLDEIEYVVMVLKGIDKREGG